MNTSTTAPSAADYAPTEGSRQSAAPLSTLPLSTTARSAREIVRFAADGQMDINAPYQRGSVWTLDQRINLVRSWLTRTPIPAIIWNFRAHSGWTGPDPFSAGSAAYGLIDGKQRVETAIAWYGGQFGAPASWFAPEDVINPFETPDGLYVTFDGLDAPMQRHMGMTFLLPASEATLNSIEDEAALFLQINTSGTDQTDADLARARDWAEGM